MVVLTEFRRRGITMTAEPTQIVETALIELSFALAELAISGNEAEYCSRARGHMKRALSELKKLAPAFEKGESSRAKRAF